jgi:hypothetical protein
MSNKCKTILTILIIVLASFGKTLVAQEVCRGVSVVKGSREDKLLLDVSGASTSQQQIQSLDAYVQSSPDQTFMPCVDEYYVDAYVKGQNYTQAIAYGQKALAAHYQDELLLLNLAKAYVGAAQARRDAFDVIFREPAEIHEEAKASSSAVAAEQKTTAEDQSEAKDIAAYMEYAFFVLLPQVPDGNQRLRYLSQFSQVYPDPSQRGHVDFQYFLAYAALNDRAHIEQYGEKSVAEDPNNVDALGMLAYDYALSQANLGKAAQYAQRVLKLVPQIPKPADVPAAQFQAGVNGKLGLAHLTLGYVDFLESPHTHRIVPAINQFKVAVPLLGGNDLYKAQALYLLASAYEYGYPPNHRAAAAALEEAVQLQTPVQEKARALLAKVRAAQKRQ